ncbi:HlyD family type I secretion periplasmic adaptor subunit [Pontivivens insulae]|uniref:Membrane fusion protein (MFP) family protein n=1 Tax=Pontivivens insulae TaxID=1639689 RepID=A0A2R8AEM6_9RHOB|nr:HlyD family type I secretion periplasmic adaptor subunit [Pontivivens insulae]RED11945.1 HlyD family secretion protein [Pontivivens insulae]SPF30701.1 Type I secretion system membrane fusion protein PrsE [Pontivivens insulae]
MSEPTKWKAGRPILLGLVALICLVGGLGYWSVATNISGAVIASGQLEVESNRQVVQHLEGGMVGAIYADDGDFVEAGAVLMRLDDTILRSELTIIESQYYELIARRGRLRAESEGESQIRFETELLMLAQEYDEIAELIGGQISLFNARAQSIAQQTNQLQERQTQIEELIVGREAQLDALSRQRELIALELVDQQSLLDRGLAQASRVLALQREEAQLEGQVGELTASIAESRGRIAELEIEIIRLSSTRQEEAITELRDLTAREAELRERRLSVLDTMARLEIRAPMTGRVFGRTVHAVNSVIRAAEPVMFIVPEDSPLVITSRIETINIDQVTVGQEAALRFSAFDQRTTPELYGVVTNVSADVILDEATGAPYYEAEILPYDGEIDKLAGLALVPGMPVDAFIQTGERSPLTFLTKPFTDYFTRAFRET